MHVLIDLVISREEYLRWYQGSARTVVAKARDGRNIRFPADALRPYITHLGVRGTFAVYFDENHKLVRIEKRAD